MIYKAEKKQQLISKSLEFILLFFKYNELLSVMSE